MERLLLIISILVLVLVPVGCTSNMVQNVLEGYVADYTIRISSDVAGLDVVGGWTGVIGTYNSTTQRVDFVWDAHPVEERIPSAGYIEYGVYDVLAVTGWFQKRTESDALLRVEIWRGEDLVEWASTTESWGVVVVVGGLE